MSEQTQRESGDFQIAVKSGQARVSRYFKFDDKSEVTFCAVVDEPGNSSVVDLHKASLQVIIGHLQKLLERANQP